MSYVSGSEPADSTDSPGKVAPLQVVVVGAGRMANLVHYPSLASLPEVSVVAACDRNAAKLHATSDRYGIEGRYTNYRKMIESCSPDAVFAIGQPHQMFGVWTWCLEQGLSLFIEKPPGISLHQAQSLAYLAERHHCITQVGFQRRACPIIVRLRDECLRHGSISYSICRFYKRPGDPFLAARDLLLNDGVHVIDTLRWICGGEVADLHAIVRGSSARPEISSVAAILDFDNGSVGVMSSNWTSGREVFAVEMHAPGVLAEAEETGGARIYRDGEEHVAELDSRVVCGSDDFYVLGGFRAKIGEFVECVRMRRQPSSSFADAVKTMTIADRILAAKWGKLSEARLATAAPR